MRERFPTWLYWALWSWVFAAVMLPPCFAQKTLTKDAGAGMKEEVDYDAAGRIVASRTIGADGKLQVKVNYSYSHGSDVIRQTSTSYWPDRKAAEKVADTTFDDSTNFVSETVADYNQAGMQVSGHQVFHDSMTGIYRCFDWNVGKQRYVAIDCPAPEESQEGPHEEHKITREEVMQKLAAARQAAESEQKAVRMKQAHPVQVAIAAAYEEVGIALPVLRPGGRVSGRVVEAPERFAEQPELMVARVSLPTDPAGDPGQLSDWTFEVSGSKPQPADGPITFVVPATGGPMEFTLRRTSDPLVAVSGRLPVSVPTPKAPPPTSYQSAALCFKKHPCVVTGKFSGDSHNTFATFDSVPVNVIAESDRAVYLDVADGVGLGPATLIVAEGTRVEAMSMVVAELDLAPNHEAAQAGQDIVSTLRVDGAQELSDEQWRYEIYPASNLERARSLVPGFSPAKVVEQDREARERQGRRDGVAKADDKRDESAGMVLVVVRNATPEFISMRGSKQQRFVFHLTPDSFVMGEFKYNIAMDGVKDGTFALNVTAIPFLAPVKAQEFEGGP